MLLLSCMTYWRFGSKAFCGATVLFVALCVMGSSSRLLGQIEDAATEDLIRQLGGQELEGRRDAVYELVRRRVTDQAVMVALAALLDDDDSQIQFQALMGLARAGESAEPALEELIECLDDRSDQVRYRAAVALGKIGASAVEPLMSRWERASQTERSYMAQAFSHMGELARPALELLSQSLKSDNERLERFAAEAIVAIIPEDETVLLELSRDSDSHIRQVGITALAALRNPSDQTQVRLRESLADEDTKIRESAIVALAHSRLTVDQKANCIEIALADSEPSVRVAASVAMRGAGLDYAVFASRVADRLVRESHMEIANSLVRTLREIGPEARHTLPVLIEVASRTDLDQDLVAQALASFGDDSVEELLNSLESNPELQPVVSLALAKVGVSALRVLLERMSSHDEITRIAATRAVGGVRPLDSNSLNHLMRALEDPSARVRETALKSLIDAAELLASAKESISDADRESIPKVISPLFNDPVPSVRAVAVQSVPYFAFGKESASHSFSLGMRDEFAEVRASAARALKSWKEISPNETGDLSDLASDPVAEVRVAALETLATLGPDALSDRVQEAVLRGLVDEEPAIRIQATECVIALKIDNDDVLSLLSANLADHLELLRSTLTALKSLGPKAEALRPTLVRLLEHEVADIRNLALTSLVAIERDRGELSSQLTRALDDSEWAVRQTAAQELAKLGPDAMNAIPRLFRMLGNEEDSEFARTAIRAIDAAPVEAIPMLIDSLDSEDRRTSYYAIFLLGKIGPDAKDALPRLEAELTKSRGNDGREGFLNSTLKQAIDAIKGTDPQDDQN